MKPAASGSVNGVARPAMARLLLALLVPAAAVLSAPGTAGCRGEYRMALERTPRVDPWAARPKLAVICLLRPQHFGKQATFFHLDNGKLVGVTRGARLYFCYLALPGWHRVRSSSDNDVSLTLFARAGGRYFIRLLVRYGRDGLLRVNETEARKLIRALRYVAAHPARKGVRPVFTAPVPPLPHPRSHEPPLVI